MSVVFSQVGIKPVLKERLNKWVRGINKFGATNLRRFVDILSGPQLFLIFNLLNASRITSWFLFANTKFSLHGSPRYSEKCLFDKGIDFAKLGHILTKKSLNPSAISNEPESI